MGVFPSPSLFPSPTLFPAAPPTTRGGAVGSGEIEITTGRRAFAKAQELFSGAPVGSSQRMSVGWHDTSVNAETGSFAVVQAGFEDLVGEIVRVTSNRRQVFCYVLDTADVPVQLSVTRRVFLALNRLTIEALPADVVAVN